MNRPIPLLPDRYHWAKHSKKSEIFHIADPAGRLLCDGGPSISRGVGEPDETSKTHGMCLNALTTRRSP